MTTLDPMFISKHLSSTYFLFVYFFSHLWINKIILLLKLYLLNTKSWTKHVTYIKSLWDSYITFKQIHPKFYTSMNRSISHSCHAYTNLQKIYNLFLQLHKTSQSLILWACFEIGNFHVGTAFHSMHMGSRNALCCLAWIWLGFQHLPNSNNWHTCLNVCLASSSNV